MHWKFKEAHTLEQRKRESRQILSKYPDRVPVVVQRAPNSALVDLDKHKFLVPYEVTVAQFMWILRQRLTLSHNKAIYIFVNKTLPQSSALIGELYTQYKDEDGFIYIMYSGENTFGIDGLINNRSYNSQDNNVIFYPVDDTSSSPPPCGNLSITTTTSTSNTPAAINTRGRIDFNNMNAGAVKTIALAPVNCYITCCSRSFLGHGDNNR